MVLLKTLIKPFSTTGLGSLPHRDAQEAAALCIQAVDIPFWPQLPNLSFRELMIPQFSEGMPSVRVDEEKRSLRVERNEEEIERFYESSGGEARLAISEEYAKGFYAFLEQIKNRRFDVLKGQITGPLTFTLGLADRDGRPVYFDEEMREIGLMLLSAKARWQVDMLKPYAKEVIIFIDEPVLPALGGTSYMGVTREETVRLLGAAVAAIREAGGIAGIHCCGRAEWPLILETGVDILNFDAYDFGDTLGIYPDEIRAFLKAGGYLAWGIVPTTDAINRESEESVQRLFGELFERLTREVGAETLKTNIMLTPSCGTGARTMEEALKVFQILMRLKESLS